MKKILIIIGLMIAGFCSKAQIMNNSCQYLQQYEGTWLYSNGQESIKIVFRFFNDYSANAKVIKDNLYGWYEYKQGSTVIATTLRSANATLHYNYDDADAPIPPIALQLVECTNSCLHLNGTIKELVAGNFFMVDATLNAAKTTLTWHQQNREGYGGHPMILPKTFVLVKQ